MQRVALRRLALLCTERALAAAAEAPSASKAWPRHAAPVSWQWRAYAAPAAVHNKQDAESSPLFSKLLVANRGEIACRIMRTAKRLGMQTVAVYSEADRNALHVRSADEAYCIGPAATSQSYLQVDAILDAVRQSKADAVHPGYGFLSENAAFARALEAQGTAFVGPPVRALEAMGDKVESKRIAKEAGVSTIPGWVGVIRDEQHAVEVAQQIGYPVMIKASAGGGGKGMRIAWNDEELAEGFRLSSAEALNFFGDARMLIEKYIEQPRHIEIQVLGDKAGRVVWLPERECSIQRRNQKVVEEAPSTFLDAATRAAMGAQAVQLASAVGYYSAGTLEFLVDRHRQFYFLEMNTRLQVEHPITEAITQQDLVEHMLRVAAGQPLGLTQDQAAQIHGWAVECRVYAEDPARGFLPCTGRLQRYVEPAGPGVRCDSGVEEGSEISMHYDPMICKLVTHAPDRPTALQRMRRALDRYVIRGLNHNIPLLRAVVAHPEFEAGNITTAFLGQHFPGKDDTAPARLPLSDRQRRQLLALAAYLHARYLAQLGTPVAPGKDVPLVATVEGAQHPLTLRAARAAMVGAESAAAGAVEVQLADALLQVAPPPPGDDAATGRAYVAQLVTAAVDGEICDVQVIVRRPRGALLQFCGAQREVLLDAPAAAALAHHMPPPQVVDTSKLICSPMPGVLVSVAVQPGEVVEAGDEVAVVEAMKMRNVLRAPAPGRVAALAAQPGAILAADQVIVRLE